MSRLSFLQAGGLFVVAEFIAAALYAVVAQIFLGKAGFDFRSILKGIIERFFLAVCLHLNYPHALTLFSALKLAMRLKHVEPAGSKANNPADNRFNDYYLVGNLMSVLLAILYVWAWTQYGPA